VQRKDYLFNFFWYVACFRLETYFDTL
jgi:hypothetical protein